MTRTPAVMEIENAISGLRLCVEGHRAGEELSGYRVSHCDVPVRCLETVLDAVTRTPAEPLADGETIEKLCRPIIGIENRTALEAFDIMADRIRRSLPAYNPNYRLLFRQLRDLAVALHRKHYAEVTEWKLLDDAPGVLSQIDNMTAGMSRNRLREALARRNQALDTAIIHKMETHSHGGLSEFGEGGLAALKSLEREFEHIDTTLSHKD